MDKFNIVIIDKKSSLQDKEEVETIVSKIINNPFATFNKMDFAYKNKWDKKPDILTATKETLKKKANIAFGPREPHFFLSSFDKDTVQNVVFYEMDRSYLDLFDLSVFVKLIIEFIDLFDTFNYASIKTIPNVSDYYLKHNISTVPSDCFRMYPNWIQFLSPKVFDADFKKEDLLNCPAYKVQEHNEEIIEIVEQLFTIEDNR